MKLNSAVLSLTNLFTKSEKRESEQFSDLYNRYQKLVRSVIFQIAGPSHLNDLVQETFIKVWTKLPEFRRESEVSSWIYRIAVNTSLDHLRSEKRHPTTNDSVLEFHRALIIFGAISFNRLGVSQMPDVDFPVLSISVNYDGASPEVVEAEIIDPIEQALLSIEGVEEMRASARQGSGNITLNFDINRNVDVALQEVQTAISQVGVTYVSGLILKNSKKLTLLLLIS